jgi:hypothetical protein
MEEINNYPIIQEWIDKGKQKEIDNLKEIIQRQMETRRYYKMKYSGKFEHYITEQDVLNEVEFFLQVVPHFFKDDINLLNS